MVIHYHNRSKLSEDKEQGATYHDSIKNLFSVSDVLSICCPATKETENLINKETVEYFPKGAVITNVARGDIVCLLYTSPSPRDRSVSRMPSSA